MTKADAKKADAEVRAREAVKAFRRMLPNLNGYARAITGNRKINIVASMETNGGTDGKTIYMRPPIKLGNKTPHNKELCDRVDENLLQRCEACRIREYVLATIYHEIAHIAYDSFSPVTATDAASFTVQAAKELGTKYARSVVERVNKMTSLNKVDYMRLAMELSPFLHMILNCLEDARINARMGEARPGVRRMMQGQLGEVMREGVEVPGPRGTVVMEHWRDRPSNAQVTIGLFFKSSRYDYSNWLSDEAIEVLDDEVITDLCEQVYHAKGPSQTYALALKALARLRELGYCRSDKDPEDEDEDESGSPEAGEGEAGDDSTPETDSDSESGDGAGSADEESTGDPEGSSDSSGDDESAGDVDSRSEGDGVDGDDEAPAPEGEGAPDAGGADVEDASDDHAEGDDLNADAEEQDEGPASGGEDGAEGEPGAPGDDEQPDSQDDVGSGDDGTSEEMAPGGSDQAGDGADDAGSGDSEGEVGDGTGGDQDSGEPESGGAGGPSPMADDSDGGVPGAEGDDPGSDVSEDGSETDDDAGASSGSGAGGSGASDGGSPTDSHDTGAEKNVGEGDIHEFIDAVARVLGHAEGFVTGPDGHMEEMIHDDESTTEQTAVVVALAQEKHFDSFSQRIKQINVYDRQKDRDAEAWSHAGDSAYVNHYGGDDIQVPESALGPALLRMRVAFSENKRAHETVNLKAGKVNARSLGRRAWGNDPRLFKRKVMPTKRDYSVVIGMDISGSTSYADTLKVEKMAVMAQAELLKRMGVRFSIWAHTGGYPPSGGLSLEMYKVKGFDEPWNPAARRNLTDITPGMANLDGHTLEFYRKQLDQENTTDRIVMYYTDGAMPAENGVEELEILQRELKLCKNKGYTVLGVGIRNSDPVKHGLDTVQVDDEMDIVKVVRHLEKRLER